MRVMNPVLRRELVERWRGRRAVVTLTVYLGILGGICYLLYRIGAAILGSGFGFGGTDAATSGPLLGRFLVEGLLFFVLLLVLFVAPGYAAAQVSGERERRTLTLLQVTLLRPRQIVFGKLGASTAWLTLLVVAALPLGAAAFFLGGIGVEDLLRGVFMTVALGVCVAAMGLGISSLTKRTTGSIVLTYGLVLALTGGTLFLSAAEAIFRGVRGGSVETPIAMYANPFYGLADAVQAQPPSAFAFGGLPSPLGLFAELLPGSPIFGQEEFAEAGVAVGGGDTVVQTLPDVEAPPPPPPPAIVDDDVGPVPPEKVLIEPSEIAVEVEALPVPGPLAQPAGQRSRAPIWLLVLGIYAVLGSLGLLLATRRLRVVEPRGRVTATAVAAPFPPPGALGPPPGPPPPPPAGPQP